MSDTIYLVMGHQLEQGGSASWPVLAFVNEVDADAKRLQLNGEAQRLTQLIQANETAFNAQRAAPGWLLLPTTTRLKLTMQARSDREALRNQHPDPKWAPQAASYTVQEVILMW